jgi:hypothetical protein
MPTVTAAPLISRAAIALQDTANVRWPRADLLEYLNAAQRALVLKKPNAYVRHSSMPLVAGTRQGLPTSDAAGVIDPIQLIEVVRNSCGRAVRLIERDLLDLVNPDWHTATPTKVVEHYCYSALDPHTVYVYPPNTGTGCLDMTCSANPPPLATESALLALDDIYADALLDFVLYRAFSKDAEYAADPQRAAAHYASFAAALDGKAAHEGSESPTQLARAARR